MSLINKMLQDLDKRGAEPAGAKIREVEAIEIQDEPRRRGGIYAGVAVAVVALLSAAYWYVGPKLMREDRVATQPAKVAAPATKPAEPAPPPIIAAPASSPDKAQPDATQPAATVAGAAPQSPPTPSVTAPNVEPAPTPPPGKDVVPARAPIQPPAATKTVAPEATQKPTAVATAPEKATSPGPLEAKETMPPPPPAAVPKRPPERTTVAQAPNIKTTEPDTYKGNISIERQTKSAPPQQRAAVDYRTGLDYMNQGRIEQAVATFSEVLLQDPRHYAARQALVTVLLERGKTAEAQRALREGLAVMPENSSWAILLARLQVEDGDPASATDTLKMYAAPAQNRADYQAFLGTVLQMQGRHQEAISYYEVATKLAPGYGAWLTGLAMSLEEEKRTPEAIDAYKRAYASSTLAPSMRSFVEGKLKQLK